MSSLEQVRNTNLKFYNIVASKYDQIDSRRGHKQIWLQNLLNNFFHQLNNSNEPSLLDAGAGSGFLSWHADGIFPEITAMDISPAMLEKFPSLQQSNIHKLVSSCEQIQAPAEHYAMVGAFATLHHLYDPTLFFQEAHRVLRAGGILYTDHDISESFVKKFFYPLKIYRYFFDHEHEYLKNFPITKEEYLLTEFHGEHGLNTLALKEALNKCGFREIHLSWHWQGAGFPEKVLNFTRTKSFFSKEGFAPMLRIIAKK